MAGIAGIGRRVGATLYVLVLLAAARADAQQELGHKTLGTLGLNAGSQLATGLYVADRFLYFHASELFDRNGDEIPIGLRMDGTANGVGVAFAYRVPGLGTWVNAAVGVPVARVTVETDRPEAAIDRFGLADVYVQPLKLGWRLPRLDLVTGYAFYAPTGSFEPGPRGGVSRAYWSHEFSLGGTVYFDRARSWTLSALGSYELAQRKIGIDFTRGDTLQIQGGAGKTLFRIFEVGLVGYAFWQLRDDRGSALPPTLRGARDKVYGLGVELGVTVPAVRARLTLRYTHDFAAATRPQGQLLLFGLGFAPWRPVEKSDPAAGRRPRGGRTPARSGE